MVLSLQIAQAGLLAHFNPVWMGDPPQRQGRNATTEAWRKARSVKWNIPKHLSVPAVVRLPESEGLNR